MDTLTPTYLQTSAGRLDNSCSELRLAQDVALSPDGEPSKKASSLNPLLQVLIGQLVPPLQVQVDPDTLHLHLAAHQDWAAWHWWQVFISSLHWLQSIWGWWHHATWSDPKQDKAFFRVGVVALNRPKALNALCGPLMQELTQALGEWDKVVLMMIVVVIQMKMMMIHFAGPKHRSNGGDGKWEGVCSWSRHQRDAGWGFCLPLYEQVFGIWFGVFSIWFGVFGIWYLAPTSKRCKMRISPSSTYMNRCSVFIGVWFGVLGIWDEVFGI